VRKSALIAVADPALYYIKETGRNGVRVSTEQAMAQHTLTPGTAE
jgi:hypothetical protein